jgi:hypothetical protein
MEKLQNFAQVIVRMNQISNRIMTNIFEVKSKKPPTLQTPIGIKKDPKSVT